MNRTNALAISNWRSLYSIRSLAAIGLVVSLLAVLPPAQAQSANEVSETTQAQVEEAETETSKATELGKMAADTTRTVTSAAQKQPLFDQGQMAQTVGGLFLVIALLFGLLWFVKRMGLSPGNRPGSFYKVLNVSSLGPKEKIALLEVGDTWLVVGMTQHSINTLHTLPKGSLDWSTPSTNASEAFSRMLEKLKTPQVKS